MFAGFIKMSQITMSNTGWHKLLAFAFPKIRTNEISAIKNGVGDVVGKENPESGGLFSDDDGHAAILRLFLSGPKRSPFLQPQRLKKANRLIGIRAILSLSRSEPGLRGLTDARRAGAHEARHSLGFERHPVWPRT